MLPESPLCFPPFEGDEARWGLLSFLGAFAPFLCMAAHAHLLHRDYILFCVLRNFVSSWNSKLFSWIVECQLPPGDVFFVLGPDRNLCFFYPETLLPQLAGRQAVSSTLLLAHPRPQIPGFSLQKSSAPKEQSWLLSHFCSLFFLSTPFF